MARYFFNIYNGKVTLDPEGCELAGDEAAMAMALAETRTLAAEAVRGGEFVGHHRIEVTDCLNRRIGRVRFDEAVAVH